VKPAGTGDWSRTESFITPFSVRPSMGIELL
jgi:hypothetical protein